MNRVFVFALVASFVFVYGFYLSTPLFQPVFQSSPDSVYTPSSPEQDSVYFSLLTRINLLFGQKRYQACLVELEKARKLKPDVASIKERILRVQGFIAQENKTNQEYAELVAKADDYFGKQDWLNAKASYQLAIDVKPRDPIAIEKLGETMKLLRSQKAQNILYDVAVAAADKLFDAGKYEKARIEYANASKIMPEAIYPKEKINAIIKIQVDRQVREELYRNAITAGDRFFETKSYNRALQEFQNALVQKPDELYPQEKVRELNQILQELAVLEEAYRQAIAQADQLFSEVRYADARTGYQEALKLKPTESYPVLKIREIDQILAQITKVDVDYNHFLNLADSLYIEKNFIRARQNYQLALLIKPNESYPKSMIAKTEAGVGEQKANELIMAEAYRSALAEADRLFGEKAFTEAKMEYTNALEIKPEETYPRQKISEIDELIATALARQNEINEQYDRILANADRMFTDNLYSQSKQQYEAAVELKPQEAYPKQKIEELNGILANLEQQREIDARYLAVMKEANRLYSIRSYDPAKSEYLKALGIKPEESLPQERIAAIDSIFLALANQQEELDARYAVAILTGDSLLTASSFLPAKTNYQGALQLKPNEPYPTERILQIDTILAELRALETEYQETIQVAERMFAAKVYDSARIEYTHAGELKPEESFPNERIAQIDGILLALANQQILDERYAGLIEQGDQLFTNTQYNESLAKFNEATGLKPEEAYPQEKITEIDAILAEIARQLTLDKQYTTAVALGDSLFTLNLLPEARSQFRTAMGIRSEESYPPQKLAEIETALQELAARQALDELYQQTVDDGDRLFADQLWDPAISSFQKALELKPEESYPALKITEIDSIKQEIARQLAIDEEYTRAVAEADQLFASRSYDSARVAYTQAGELRPSKTYWQDQVTEIDRILAEIRKRNEDYLATITRADGLLAEEQFETARDEYQNALLIKASESYPKEKISEINQTLAELEGRRNTYDRLLANGDSFLAYNEYIKSRDTYQQALDLFPEERYPKDQIRLITSKVDSIYRANRADYDKAVGEGDSFFNTFEYDRAIDAYTRALAFLPMEDYPREMIAKIRKSISENAIVDVLNEPFIIKAGKEQKFSFNPVNIASRRNNFIYLKLRNLTEDQFNILVRYGKDGQINGGLAIRNISPDGKINERLISVRNQDPWYREDNNWISLYPQGGDIEVSFIQVSRAIK